MIRSIQGLQGMAHRKSRLRVSPTHSLHFLTLFVIKILVQLSGLHRTNSEAFNLSFTAYPSQVKGNLSPALVSHSLRYSANRLPNLLMPSIWPAN